MEGETSGLLDRARSEKKQVFAVFEAPDDQFIACVSHHKLVEILVYDYSSSTRQS